MKCLTISTSWRVKFFEKWDCFRKGWGSIFSNWHPLPNAPVNEYDVANYQCETGYRFENMTNSAVGSIVVYSEENIVFELQCLGYKTWINIYVFGSFSSKKKCFPLQTVKMVTIKIILIATIRRVWKYLPWFHFNFPGYFLPYSLIFFIWLFFLFVSGAETRALFCWIMNGQDVLKIQARPPLATIGKRGYTMNQNQ